MKEKKTIENTIVMGAINIIMVLVKRIIRQHFDNEKKHKSVTDLVDKCENKLQELEIAQKKKAQQKVILNSQSQGWETDSDAIERAKKLPPRGWVLPGIIPEGSICNKHSPEKVGKSAFAKQVAIDYVHGTNSMALPDAEMSASCYNDAYIYDAELGDEDVEERYENLGDTKVKRWPNAHFKTPQQLIEHMSKSISNVNANTLVVVDNVTAVCYNFNKADVDKVWTECSSLQTDFCRRGYRLTVIFIHHTKASADGSNRNDRAGSVEWGRVGKLNLSLLSCNRGSDFRVLKIINHRGKDGLLAQGKVAVLRLVGTPYLHFLFDHVAEEAEVLSKNKKTSERNLNNDTSNNDWKLNDDEKDYIYTNYIPGKSGLGTLAEPILKNHNIEVTDKNKNHMKNVVKRALEREPTEKVTLFEAGLHILTSR